MVVPVLEDAMRQILANADEVWIAVALMKDNAFDNLQRWARAGAKQHYVVGINLPTTPSALRKLKAKASEGLLDAAIYHNNMKDFHPKAYLFRTGSSYVALVGSSNLTDGGLKKNVEMCVRVDDQPTCLELKRWFESLYSETYPLTEENISEYESAYLPDRAEQSNGRIDVKLKKPKAANDPFAGTDFSDRYFKREHHWAFRPVLWEDDSSKANRERASVKDRFLELHEDIQNKFLMYDLVDLHPNVSNHIVSMERHLEGRTSQQLDAMWLSYGKSQQEIIEYRRLFPPIRGKGWAIEEDDKQSFINHARLQIRIELAEIGIWILFGKNNEGSLFDRQHFKDKMRSEVRYRNTFFKQLSKLPPDYWITVNGMNARYTNEFENATELYDYCKRDTPKHYFIIGRNYNISDVEMSESNLPTTVLCEFQRLYPIYNFMRDKRFAKPSSIWAS